MRDFVYRRHVRRAIGEQHHAPERHAADQLGQLEHTPPIAATELPQVHQYRIGFPGKLADGALPGVGVAVNLIDGEPAIALQLRAKPFQPIGDILLRLEELRVGSAHDECFNHPRPERMDAQIGAGNQVDPTHSPPRVLECVQQPFAALRRAERTEKQQALVRSSPSLLPRPV